MTQHTKEWVFDRPEIDCFNGDHYTRDAHYMVAVDLTDGNGDYIEVGGLNQEEIATFIQQAGTVATECGLTPRQLLDQRNELLEALKWYVENDDTCESIQGNEFFVQGLNKAREAIKRAEARNV